MFFVCFIFYSNIDRNSNNSIRSMSQRFESVMWTVRIKKQYLFTMPHIMVLLVCAGPFTILSLMWQVYRIVGDMALFQLIYFDSVFIDFLSWTFFLCLKISNDVSIYFCPKLKDKKIAHQIEILCYKPLLISGTNGIALELESFNVNGTDEIFKFIEITPKYILFQPSENYELKTFSDPVDHQSPALYENPFIIMLLFIYGWKKGTTKQKYENCITLFWLRRQV